MRRRAMAKMVVLDPTADRPQEWASLPQRLDTLEGKVIGFNVHWARFDDFIARVEEIVHDSYSVAGTIRFEGRPIVRDAALEKEWQEWLERSDAAILGLGA